MTQSASADGLLWAWHLNGTGGAKALSLEALQSGAGTAGTPEAPVWIHLQLTDAGARALAASEALALPPLAAEALFADETRPRTQALDEGLLINLRGVNLNPNAEPEDMVSVRLWFEPGRIISVRGRGVMAVREVSERLAAGTGPRHAAGILAEIARGLGKKVTPILTTRKDALDSLEEQAGADDGDGAAKRLRHDLAELRAEVIALARYLRPQVQAVRDILEETAGTLPGDAEDILAAAADRFLRQVEDLDALRDQAQVLQDRLDAILAERMSRTTYMLSVVAGIFLPLSFVTGLLGMNVGGIPLAETDWGFAIVSAAMVAVTLFEIWLFKRLRWI